MYFDCNGTVDEHLAEARRDIQAAKAGLATQWEICRRVLRIAYGVRAHGLWIGLEGGVVFSVSTADERRNVMASLGIVKAERHYRAGNGIWEYTADLDPKANDGIKYVRIEQGETPAGCRLEKRTRHIEEHDEEYLEPVCGGKNGEEAQDG